VKRSLIPLRCYRAWDWPEADMTDDMKPAWELEQEARATSATDWEPPPGMVKRQCVWCRHFYATGGGRGAVHG
jgi:hypothetical protein